MRIQPNYNINNRIYAYNDGKSTPFKAQIYSPKNSIFTRINPGKMYLQKMFERTLVISRARIQPIIPALIDITKEIPLNSKKKTTYAWDINDGTRKKYALILHGMSQNVSNLQPLYKEITEKTDFAVFAPEYRGFGKNPKSVVSTKTFAEDTALALEYLKKKGIKQENIYVIGHSLGGYIASQLVQKNPDLGRLILVSSIDSLKKDATNFLAAKNSASPAILYLYEHFKILRSPIERLFKTGDCLKKINTPIDIIHSTNDTVVKSISAERIAKKCKNLQSLHLLKTGGHAWDNQKINTIISILS